MIQKYWILIVLFSLFSTALSAAPRRGSSSMANTFYVQGMIGRSILAEIDDRPATASGDQDIEGGTALTGVVGYRWKYFSLEMLASQFGTLEVDHDGFYKETHKASFVGGGLHWTWWFFDLKLGWGNMKNKSSYAAGSKATSFSANPQGSSGQTATYFGFGFNFDLDHRTELVIDYTGYAFTRKPQSIELNGTTSSFSDPTIGIGTASIGIRVFW